MSTASDRYFPPPHGGMWDTVAPEDAGIDAKRLEALIAFARAHESDFERGPDYPAKKATTLRNDLGAGADTEIVGPFAEAVGLSGLVVRGGRIVVEFGDTAHADEIASASKSFLSAVAGVAFDSGLIGDLHRAVYQDTGLTLLASPHNRAITWHHLLQQTSEWDGELFGKHPRGHRGAPGGLASHAPGDFFEYNDVRVNLLARCLLELFQRPLPEVLRESIMDPIGASRGWSWHGYATSTVEIAGVPVESVSGGAHWGGGVWMGSRDLARFGLLYLNGGAWKDRRLLSGEWIARTRTPCERNPMYGYLWWLQHDAAGRQVSFAAQGGGAHQAIVIPAYDMVIAFKWLQDRVWMEFLERALGLVNDRPPISPPKYVFDQVNAGVA